MPRVCPNLRLDLAGFGVETAGEQPRLSRFVFAKADDAVYAGSARRLGKKLEVYIVAIQQRPSVRVDTNENPRPGGGDGCERRKELQMRRFNRGDHRDMRSDQPAQRRDLAGMVHAQLEDAVAGVGRYTRQSERRTPLGVEVAFARCRRTRRRT